MKKIVFLTGTRADFGKLKSLIEIIRKDKEFEVFVFVTGMHMNKKYGKTYIEIQKHNYKNTFYYYNHNDFDSMDAILAKTIEGFSNYIKDIEPDLIVIHGDRVEALAGAIVGSLNNLLTAHIEGGEVSGTIDDSIRHAVSKISHVHFVANQEAKKRLLQLGELEDSIFIIGSPDIDVMLSSNLPSEKSVKDYYGIKYNNYSICIFHPVTTEHENMLEYANNLTNVLIESKRKYIIIHPNNDLGSEFIFHEFNRLKDNPNFKIFPSLRFEYFIVLLKNCDFIIGNSSAGIREAPYFGTSTVNIGTRQKNRANSESIINTGYSKDEIELAIEQSVKKCRKEHRLFGEGNSDKLFYHALKSEKIWNTNRQKFFNDL